MVASTRGQVQDCDDENVTSATPEADSRKRGVRGTDIFAWLSYRYQLDKISPVAERGNSWHSPARFGLGLEHMKRGRSENGRDEQPADNRETSPSRDKTQYLYRLFALHPSVSRNTRHLVEHRNATSPQGRPEPASNTVGASGQASDLSIVLNQTNAPSPFQSAAATSSISPMSRLRLDEAPSDGPGQLTVLVTTAAGHQGSAVARSLLAASTPVLRIHVRCLMRNPAGPMAQSLQTSGAQLYQGDLSSVSALRTAVKGCDAVFLNTQPSAGDEEQQARNVVEVVKDEGVRHIVASTSSRVEEYQTFKVFQESPTHPMLSFFRGKAAVQDLLREWVSEATQSGTDRFYTVLQLTWIMTDFLAPFAELFWGTRLATEGVLTTAFKRETKVPLVSGQDVGRFASQAFLDVARGGDQRQRWNGSIVPLAGEQLTMEEIATIMGEVGEKKLEVEYMTDLATNEQRDVHPYVFFQWWEMLDGSGVDLDEVRKFGLQITTFREFLQENRERLELALGVGN